MLCGGVAQLGEHLPCKQGVMSSNLTISMSKAPSNGVHAIEQYECSHSLLVDCMDGKGRECILRADLDEINREVIYESPLRRIYALHIFVP